MDKQIEEMTKETCGQQIYPYGKDRPICWLTKEDCTCRADNQCDHYEVCERIYKAGYRKIPEGSVVSAREEKSKEVNDLVKEKLKKFAERLEDETGHWDNGWHIRRKAEEICKELVD